MVLVGFLGNFWYYKVVKKAFVKIFRGLLRINVGRNSYDSFRVVCKYLEFRDLRF